MKVIIDIPKKDYDKMCKGELIDTILVALKNGKSIPDNATNGDILKMMFPKDYISIYDRSVSSWWNAPYTKEVEE